MSGCLGFVMKKSSMTATFKRFFDETGLYGLLLAKIAEPDFKVIGDSREKHKLAEALAIKTLTAWEVFIENLLIDCLNRDTSQYASHRDMRIPKHLPRDVCELLLTGVRFLDIKNTGDLKRIAKNTIVPRYNPFKEIKGRDSSKIDEFYQIRNYLAHRSRSSKHILRGIYQNRHGIGGFTEPGKFLTGFDGTRKPEKVTRMQTYLSAFFNAAETMENYLT